MIINKLILSSNPFIQAYVESDWVGKLIFIALISLSVITWVLFLYKFWLTRQAYNRAEAFRKVFLKNRLTPLQIDAAKENLNPFMALYWALKKHTLEILHKNQYAETLQPGVSMLSPTDIQLVETQMEAAREKERGHLERHLYILSTIVTLAPFLGLLGTVWGILTTFSHLQSAAGGSNQLVLGGLSLALATTVLGLVDAIPALIGYNYLRNRVKEMDSEMCFFATEILAAVELQYRQVDL